MRCNKSQGVKLCPLLEHLKQNLITDMYLTGNIDGKYFGVVSRSKCNGIKEYIKGCLYKQHIGVDSQLVDDCYNVLFEQLQLMSAAKLLGLYNESPRKLLATCLRIIALKCFAKDNRLNRPNHSLIESVRFASVLHRDNTYLNTTEFVQHNDDSDSFANVIVIPCTQGDAEPFERKYGFSVEEIVALMTDDERLAFYDAIGTQRRGKQSTALKEERAKLFESILRYKSILQQTA